MVGLLPPVQAFPAAPSFESQWLEPEILMQDIDSCTSELLFDSKRQKCWVLMAQILIQKVPKYMSLGEQIKPAATVLTPEIQSDWGF